MISSVLPVTHEDCTTVSGRPFFKVFDGQEEVVLHVRNISLLERAEDTQTVVKDIISQIWSLLELPESFIDANLLRKVFNFDDVEQTSFVMLAKEKGMKPSKLARNLLCQELPEISTGPQGLLYEFMNSQLACHILQDLVDLPFSNRHRKLQTVPISRHLADIVDKEFLQSPMCCLYVKNVDVKLGQCANMRTSAVFEMEHRPLLAGGQLQEGIQELNVSGCNTVYFYGQQQSGFFGVTGDFYLDIQEYEQNKKQIMNRWEQSQSRNHDFKKPKWYDNYAGVSDPKSSSVKFVLQDGPPHSTVATLSGIKKNLIMFAYICQTVIKCQQHPESALYTKEPTIEDLAETVLSYFYQDESTAKMHKCPLRCSPNSGCYLKVQEYVTIPSTFSNRATNMQLMKSLEVNMDKASAITSVHGRNFNHIPFTNALSMLQLRDNERHALGEDEDEHGSLMLVPVNLTSYENVNPMFSVGISRWNKIVSDRRLPVVVGKASLLYGKRSNQKCTLFLSADGRKETTELNFLASKMKMMIEGKYVSSFQDACELLSVPQELHDLLRNMVTE